MLNNQKWIDLHPKHNPIIQYSLLIVIVLISTALRLYKLGQWSFWIDEIFTVNATHYLSEWSLARLPIYLVLTRGAFDLLGISEWSARIVPAILGIVTVPILYFPLRRIFGVSIALLSVFLLSISPWHLYWSQNARFYTLVLLLFSLALLLFLIGVKENKTAYLIGAAILLGLATREKVFGFFSVPVIVSFIVLMQYLRPGKFRLTRSGYGLFVGVPLVMLVSYEMYRIIFQGQELFLVSFLNTFFGNPNHSPIRLLMAFVYQVSIPVVCLGLFGGIQTLIQREYSGIFMFLGAILPLILLAGMAIFMFTHDRYGFITLPFWIVLCAISIVKLMSYTKGFGVWISMGVLILVVGTYLSQDLLYYEYQNGNRSDWRGAFASVQALITEGQQVYSTRPEMNQYYLNAEATPINRFRNDPAVVNEGPVWFFIDEESGAVKPEVFRWIQKNADLIDIRKVQVPGNSLDIRIYRYDPGEALGHNP